MASRKENVSNDAKAAAADLHQETLVKPPKPARSAFMCFSDAKQEEFMSERATKKKELIKHVAEAWRALSPHERFFWEEEARNDKIRYVRQRNAYKGPWELPKRRAKKHPLAPKRPMSAFLKYSQVRRKQVKEDNPDMNNTDVSRLLGEMWRNASPKERTPYVEQEEKERAIYKKDIARFRADQAKLDAASRTSHRSVKRMNDYHLKEESPHVMPEESNVASSHHQMMQYQRRSIPEYREEQIAPVASSDSHSLHAYKGPQYEHYPGPQYSSRNHPPFGTVSFSLSSSDGEHPNQSHGRSYVTTPPNTQPLPPSYDYDEHDLSRSRHFADNSRYYSRFP